MKITHYLLLLSTLLILSACVEIPIIQSIIQPTTTEQPAPKLESSAAPPILQIDPGGHKSKIRDVIFTPDGRYLVSASDDKLIRVWDIETGKTVRTLRGQIGEGHEGKIFAMAMSPDGKWLAVGGWTHSECVGRCGDIRLYNFPTGKLVALLKGHTDVIASLAFSPNSRYLVSGSFDQNAILWDVKQKQSLHILSGHTDQIYAVAFTSDSKRVVTGSVDHMRLWQVRNGKQLTTLKGHSDKVQAIAISPQDGTIASGSWDHTIRLWDGRSGDFIKILANQGTTVGSLSFSPDGHSLLSSCGYGDCTASPEHVYSVPSGKELLSYKAHGNIVLATAISPDGRWAATGGGSNKEIHIWNLRSGKLKQRLVGVGASTLAVGFSEDGKRLAWGKTAIQQYNQAGKLEHHLTLPTATTPLSPPKELKQAINYLRAQDQWRSWSIHTRKGGSYGYQAILEIRNQNNTQASIERGYTDGYAHLSNTFAPNGETIISGGANGVLTAYNRTGNKLGDYIGHTGDVWALAVSPDGSLLASASGDQTVRLWNLETRENLLTIFHGSDGEWVAWTPSGYYTASPNGDKMIGWQINRGVDKAAGYISAKQVRHLFYRPDIIDNTIKLRSAKQAIAQAANTEFKLETLNTALPPKFSIIDPINHSTTSSSELEIVLSFKDSQEPLENLVAYVNSSLVGKLRKWSLSGVVNKDKQKTLTLPLQPGKNQIRIVAKNRIGFTTQNLDINFKSRKSSQKGTLYLVAVGVSEYQNPSQSLKFPAADAQSIHDYFVGQTGKLYNRVETRLLADGATRPTAANIKAALNLFKQAKAQDTVILFLAGHGVKETADYYFLPYDSDANNPNSMIKWNILQNALEDSQGRRILLVDTCHSGGAYNSRLVKDSSDNNIVVISATDSQSVAQEDIKLGHGVFTYALLQGLEGGADMFKDNIINIKELDAYLSNIVPKLTNGSQVPVLHAPGGFKDFVFAKL